MNGYRVNVALPQTEVLAYRMADHFNTVVPGAQCIYVLTTKPAHEIVDWINTYVPAAIIGEQPCSMADVEILA
jgi:hypothetical protein